MAKEILSPIDSRLARISELEKIKAKREVLMDNLESFATRPRKTSEQIEAQRGRIIDFILEKEVSHTEEKAKKEVQVGNYRRALRHQTKLTFLQSNLNNAAQGLAEGRVTPVEFSETTSEYSNFVARYSEDDGIKEGLRLIADEEKWKREQEGAKLDTPPTATTVYEAKPKRDKTDNLREEGEPVAKLAADVRIDHTGTEDEVFTLGGVEFTGNNARILELVSAGHNTRKDLANILYPGVNFKVADRRVGTAIKRIKGRLDNSGFGLLFIKAKIPGDNRARGYYDLVEVGAATDKVKDTTNQPPMNETKKAVTLEAPKRLERVPVYGDLDEYDVALLAEALYTYKGILEPILGEFGIEMLPEDVIKRLKEMGPVEPIANLISTDFLKGGALYLARRTNEKFINKERSNTLELVRKMIAGDSFKDIAEQIKGRNEDVHMLLMNLSEMEKVYVLSVNGGDTNLHGFDFLKKLFADPGIRRLGFRVVIEIEDKTKEITPELTTPAETPMVELNVSLPDVTPTPEVSKREALFMKYRNLRGEIEGIIHSVLDDTRLREGATLGQLRSHYNSKQFEAIKRMTPFVPRNNKENGMYDVAELSALRYLAKYGNRHPDAAKKLIVEIIREEYCKLQK
jgi:hypothetical protein